MQRKRSHTLHTPNALPPTPPTLHADVRSLAPAAPPLRKTSFSVAEKTANPYGFRHYVRRKRLLALVAQRNVQLLGPIRQELLSGIREGSQFRRIREHLREFPNAGVDSTDYEEAARISNLCRQRGIAATGVNMLLCAVARRYNWEIFTTDRDFIHYAQVVPVQMSGVDR